MALHEQCVGATDEWMTPPYIFEVLGCSFDMDVASPGRDVTPWIPAREFITANSLLKPWAGFIWCNPPFGPRNGLEPWFEKFVRHGNGIILTPDRTSAPWWQTYTPCMELLLFVRRKIHFIDADGQPGKSPAQGTCLMTIGKQGREALHRARSLGLLMVPA